MDAGTSTRTWVIGTAGHVDHGKSTLVRALTGIDPDRLAEEKARQMTIDLGFAWLDLAPGARASVVDVPGHERFIKNMLAGVGGIDAAMLVIAADEGPMPQTAEHLAILDLLGIGHGVVVLTKADLVDDEWLEIAREEVRERLAGTSLAEAPIVAVSSTSGAGLDELRSTLLALLQATPPRGVGNRGRLPVDRVFSVTGFGTVVTGTLLDGDFRVGQEVTIQPAGLETRIRGLQSHGEKTDLAHPGSRTAVNLAGVAVEQVRRGDVVAMPGALAPTTRLDARVRLLPDAPVALEQNSGVDFFIGASEEPAWVTLLDRDRLEPGQEAWVQFRFRHPVVAMRGDRFIIRRPSPSLTVGGGEVIDPAPQRHRRFRPEVLAALETLALGTPDDVLLQRLREAPVVVADLLAHPPGGLDRATAEDALAELVETGRVRPLGAGRSAVATTTWEELVRSLQEAIGAFHATNPLRAGMPREEARKAAGLDVRLFDDLLATAAAGGALADDGATVRLAGWSIQLDPALEGKATAFITALQGAPFVPPSPAEFGIDPPLLAALAEQGRVVRTGEGIVYDPAAWTRIERETLEMIDRAGKISLADYRDHFGTSRKYAQAALEYMDSKRVTRRVGDERVRGARSREGSTE